MDKWEYIERIRHSSDYDNNDYLLELMEKYNKISITEITYKEAKEFWFEMMSMTKRR